MQLIFLGITYNEICKAYVNWIRKRYGMNVTVVFDGYSNNPSTKDITHIRRTKGKVGQSVLFTGEKVFRSKKDDFLLNLENKQQFLHLLADKINAIGLEAK